MEIIRTDGLAVTKLLGVSKGIKTAQMGFFFRALHVSIKIIRTDGMAVTRSYTPTSSDLKTACCGVSNQRRIGDGATS